ncbi:MAG: hypothetical protein PWQ76_326 [Clostridiales bacterium]|jgi:alcohol dehydrogenase class IV|nr:alcohol dehydrogenase [Oscillospiraceae bacterium]MDN5378073.1 hypothetical protein [Clostridiales bacterium]
MPTKVIMGKDCIAANAGELAALGKKALIVTGRNSAKANGSLADVIAALSANGQKFEIFDKVMSNPTIDCVYDGAKAARDAGADFIVAIGGGSPMDAAKGIALLARQDIPREELFSGKYPNDVLPMAFVPTTAGTGSEVTPYSILTNDKLQTKTSIASPLIFPKIAFLDAKYTEGLSKATAINTAIDALSHSVEGMLSTRANRLTDCLAAESIEGIFSCMDSLKTGKLSFEEREMLLYSSMLGGMVIAHTGTTAVHSMGYSLTYFRDIDHGRANGLLLGDFLKLVEKTFPAKVSEIVSFGGLSSAEEFKARLSDLLGEKESFAHDELEKYADIAVNAKNVKNGIVVPTKEEILSIYQNSLME